jgi:hypothetical protein
VPGSAHWHSSVPPELRELCESACKHAPRQLDALMLKSQGYGTTMIGRVLGITEKAARGLLDRAELNVRQEQAARFGYRS